MIPMNYSSNSSIIGAPAGSVPPSRSRWLLHPFDWPRDTIASWRYAQSVRITGPTSRPSLVRLVRALRGEPGVALLSGLLRPQPSGNDRSVLTARLRLLVNWCPHERGIPLNLQASEPCLQSALAWSPGSSRRTPQCFVRRDFGGLVHLLPNWGASTRGCYPDARW